MLQYAYTVIAYDIWENNNFSAEYPLMMHADNDIPPPPPPRPIFLRRLPLSHVMVVLTTGHPLVGKHAR
jgi:hypothetical protein